MATTKTPPKPPGFLGSESKFAEPTARPHGAPQGGAAKLASDPNNQSVALKALTPIRHDGEDFAPGETFEAGPADAAELIKQGAAQAA